MVNPDHLSHDLLEPCLDWAVKVISQMFGNCWTLYKACYGISYAKGWDKLPFYQMGFRP